MMLALFDLRLSLGAIQLDVNARIGQGITGLSGPSGSGKTSLLEIIAGLRPEATGRILLHNKVLQDSTKAFVVPPWQRKIGYVPQDQSLFPHWTVRQNLQHVSQWAQPKKTLLSTNRRLPAPTEPRTETSRTRSDVYQQPAMPPETDDMKREDQVIQLLELRPLLDRRTPLLSGGEKARVALARALMSRPVLLLLDEPLVHLDDRLRSRAQEYLKESAALFDLPMILVSHSARELASLCGTVLRMEAGRIIDE